MQAVFLPAYFEAEWYTAQRLQAMMDMPPAL